MDEKMSFVITYPTEADDTNQDSLAILNSAQKRPLVLLLGWAGCLDKHLAKYSSLYEQKRYITVRYIAPASTYLFNNKKLSVLAKELLETLFEKKLNDHPIFFHVFSNGGCYNYCNIVRLVLSCTKYENLQIKGCIIDSAPGKSRVWRAAKASMSMFRIYNTVSKYCLCFLVVIYLFISRFFYFLMDKIKYSSNAFLLYEGMLNDRGRWPQLFLYSKADEIIKYQDVEEVVEHRKALGVKVTSVCWENSPHVSHLPFQKESYTNLCQQFVESCLKV